MAETEPLNGGDPKNAQAAPQLRQDIGAEIILFVKHIDALANTLPLAIGAIDGARKKARQELIVFLGSECKPIGSDGPQTTYSVASGQIPKLQRLVGRMDGTDLAQSLVPRGLLVALVSQFDAYVGALIRQLFKLRPEIVDSSGNTLTFSQLATFGSIEAAREYVIDKEIENVLRKSHSEQFEWLETKFNTPLRKDLPAWPVFVEVTERRNLFVHTNGVMSHQYIEVCRRHACKIPEDVGLGMPLPITAEYFGTAYECLLEIGVKLGHVLWRKIVPDDLQKADVNLTNITFSLISEDRYQLARVLLDFGTQVLKRHSSEEARLIMIVNRAQTYKWSNDDEECRRILNAEDWSATSLKFKLANAVLLDDFVKANEYVKQIGLDAEIGPHGYRDWPLFREFRKSPEFAALFKQIFGEALNRITVDRDKSGGEPGEPVN